MWSFIGDYIFITDKEFEKNLPIFVYCVTIFAYFKFEGMGMLHQKRNMKCTQIHFCNDNPSFSVNWTCTVFIKSLKMIHNIFRVIVAGLIFLKKKIWRYEYGVFLSFFLINVTSLIFLISIRIWPLQYCITIVETRHWTCMNIFLFL